MLRAIALLSTLLLAPLAGAQTLASLEEPHAGTDTVWPIEVTPEESEQRIVIFRNPPRSPFRLIVYDNLGAEVYAQNATRGLQTLPALEPGSYKFFTQGTGAFQVTKNAFEKTMGRSIKTTLNGTDAYVFAPTSPACVHFLGNVTVEWWNLIGAPEDRTPPFYGDAGVSGSAYIMTVRGEEGAPYEIELVSYDERCHVGHEETPGIGAFALVALAGAIALIRRRR